MDRARPALLLVTASLIPVIILAAVVGWFFIREQQKALDTDIQTKAAILAGALQRELANQMQLLAIVGESPRLDPPIARSAFSELGRRLRERLSHWEQIRVSDLDGQVVLSVPQAELASHRPVVDLESHERVVQTGIPLIGNVALGPRGRAAFAVRVPIQRKDKVRAVLSAVVRPAIVTELLYAAGLPPTWTAWVVDGQDRLVASTGAPALAGSLSSEFATFSGASIGSATLKDGGELRVSEVALSETPWRVRVGLPVAEYSQLATSATTLLMGASCLTLLLSGSAAFLFHREVRARSRERETVANWQRMDALGKLTGQAAHDFNNLLMVFQSGVEGIKRRRNDEKRVNQLLSHMSEGVSRGKAITQRLLSFSRRSNQGAEHVDLDVKLLELNPLLQQAVNDSILIDIKIPEDTWPVHVDPASLEIALINLFTNSREAMEDGGRITVSARNIAEVATEDPSLKGPYVALTITDTGSGIASAHVQRVFEPFFTTKPSGGGGLGLTQVHSFAQRSGGSVKVLSVAGHGSAFTLLLPKSHEQRSVQETSAESMNLPSALLLVDDTPSSLESARLALDGLVAKIFTASGGQEALRILESHPEIQAVISDVMMPGMSGLELAERLSQIRPDMPVVLMTGYSDKLEAGAEVGCPVVAKPFKIEELAASLAAARPDARSASSNVVRLDTGKQL